MDPADHFEPGLLEQILGLGAIAGQSQEIAVQAVLVAVEEKVERLGLPTAKPGGLTIRRHPVLRSESP